MIWHIFRKDCKLMWKATVSVAALQLAFAIIQLKNDLGRGNPVIEQFDTLLMMSWLIASVILVIMLVQQDGILGTKQDWLTRPIRRRDIIIAKILFATMAVQGATIAGDLIQGLGNGFPLKQVLSAALSRAAIGFIAITLSALALGALTQTIADAMVMSVVLLVGAFLFTVMATAIAGDGHQYDPTNMTGVAWIPDLLRYALLLVGVLTIVIWQYQTRHTFQGRVAAAVVLLAVLCSRIIPWAPVFAVEKGLSARPGTADTITMAWRSDAFGALLGQSIKPVRPTLGNRSDGSRLILPLSIIGMPPDAVLKEDKSQVTLLNTSGQMLDRVSGGDIEIRHEDGAHELDRFDQEATISARVAQEQANAPVQISVTYWMTLFTLRSTYTMRATNDDQMLAGLGRCRTEVDGAYTAVEMSCLQMGSGPTCATVFLEDPHDGSRNQGSTTCSPNYSPYLERPIPDATSHFRLLVQYRDPAGSIKYPVDASKLAESQIRIYVYEPVDHFIRVVTSPLVAMKDLTALEICCGATSSDLDSFSISKESLFGRQIETRAVAFMSLRQSRLQKKSIGKVL